MSFNKPTVGRIVHYFPAPHSNMYLTHAFHAAMVVAVRENERPNLLVYTDIPGEATVHLDDVPHQSEAEEGGNGYWDWPVQVPNAGPKPPEKTNFPLDEKQPGAKA